MKTLFRLIIGVLFILPHTAGPLSASGSGTTSADFLKFGIGARAIGMGGAFAAVADDVTAVYWNPAGLAMIDHSQLALIHNEAGEGIRHEFMGYCLPVRPLRGSLAGSLSYLTVSDIQGYDTAGVKTDIIESWDKSYSLSYAFRITPYLSAGFNAKGITEKLDTYEASAFAGDAGVLYRVNGFRSHFLNRFSFGFVYQNYGSKLKFIDEAACLPENLVTAAAYETRLYGNRLTIAADYNLPQKGGEEYINAGLEYEASSLITLRCGYQSKDDLAEGFRAGAGLRFKSIDINYAFVPRGDFDASHRISLIFRFMGEKIKSAALDNIERQFERGRRYYEKGDTQKAAAELKSVLSVAPGHVKAAEYLALIESAEKRLNIKDNVSRHIAAGEKLFKNNKLGDAQAEFDKALAFDPGNERAKEYIHKIKDALKNLADSLYKQGVAYFDNSDYGSAIEAMNKVLIIDKDNRNAAEYLSLSRKKQLETEDARKNQAAREKQDRVKKQVTALFNKGLVLYEDSDYNNAIIKFREALSLNPDYEIARQYLQKSENAVSEGLYSKAKKAYADNDLSQAVTLLEEALSRNRENEDIKSLLSVIKNELKRINKNKAFTYNKQALVYYSNGNAKGALELWSKALELDPEMEEARVSIERVQKELKQ